MRACFLVVLPVLLLAALLAVIRLLARADHHIRSTSSGVTFRASAIKIKHSSISKISECLLCSFLSTLGINRGIVSRTVQDPQLSVASYVLASEDDFVKVLYVGAC